MGENDVTPSNIMEMKTDVTKNQNGVRTALNNITRFCPVNLLPNKTRFFSIACRGAVLELILTYQFKASPMFRSHTCQLKALTSHDG